MSNPSWSTDNISFTPLPGYYMIGGRPKSTIEENLIHETGNGVRFTYNMYTREVRELVFHVLEDDIQDFRDLHDYAAGESYSFYFSLSGVGAADSIRVNKEAGFDPREMQRTKDGILYEYTLTLQTAIV